jgi:hypothetical protein
VLSESYCLNIYGKWLRKIRFTSWESWWNGRDIYMYVCMYGPVFWFTSVRRCLFNTKPFTRSVFYSWKVKWMSVSHLGNITLMCMNHVLFLVRVLVPCFTVKKWKQRKFIRHLFIVWANSNIVKVKVPHNRLESPEGGRGIAVQCLDLGTKRGWVVSITPRPLYTWERFSTHWTGGWVGPRAGLDVCEKSRPYRDSISGPSSP